MSCGMGYYFGGSMNDILVIMMMWNGVPINHFQPIDRHGYLNRTVCLDLAQRFRKAWEAREGAEIIFIGCEKGGQEI